MAGSGAVEGFALAAALSLIRLTILVASCEITVGNLIHFADYRWINWLAGFGAILPTFLAGVKIAAGSTGR